MSAKVHHAAIAKRPVPTAAPVGNILALAGLLQRKCACGGTVGASGECENCKGTRAARPHTNWSVNVPRDEFEQEADRVAEAVVSGAPVVAARAEVNSRLQRAAIGKSTSVAPPIVHEVLQSVGQPLAPHSRAFMESRLGHDFSQVRVHTDMRAAESARALNAQAYTAGSRIVFAQGAYSPSTANGRRLLAHELAHVVQQEQGCEPYLQRQATSAPGPAAAPAGGGLSLEMLEQIARKLREAMAGWGTDEEVIYAAFAGRTNDQVATITNTYNAQYNRDLASDLQDELSEAELKHLAALSPGVVEIVGTSPQAQATGLADMVAVQLQEAVSGWGTDESAIFSALTGRTPEQREAIKKAFKQRTGHELQAELEDELSGSDLVRALALLNQGLLALEDQIYFAVKGLGTDEDALFRALETIKGDRAKITATIDAYAAKGYGDMLDDIRDDLSGSDFDRAMELLHGSTPSGSCSTHEREKGLASISGAVSLAQNATGRLTTDIAKSNLSSDVRDALSENFNPGRAANVVNIALATAVRTTLETARSDLLGASDITCDDLSPCVPVRALRLGEPFTAGVTPLVPGATVRLCPVFFASAWVSESAQSRIMLHEFVHHTGIDDKFYRHEPGYSTLIPSGDKAATDSLDNADSYASCAHQLG